MKYMLKKFFLSLLIVGLSLYVISIVKAKSCPLIPREVLFGNTDKKLFPQTSPDGKYLSYLAPVNNVMNIWLKTIDKNDDRPISNDTDRGIQGYWWSFNNKQLFYKQDVGGNKNWRLYGVSIEDRSVKEYTPYDGVQVSMLEYVKEFPNRMLIELNKRDPKAHDVYELNTKTGELVMVFENPGNVVEWVADSELFVRGRLESIDEGGFKFFVRNAKDAPWKEVASWGLDEVTPNNFHFSKDSKYLFLTDSRDSNTSRLIKIDLSSGKITEIASDPEYDMEGSLLVDNDTQEILAINYTKNRKHWVFFNPAIEDAFSVLKEIDHGDISLLNRSADDTLWVVSFVKDNGPIAFWLFNRATGQKTFLFDHQPIYKKYKLSSMEPIEFHARDGLLIHGYLTYPCSSHKKNLPLIIDVHGGPWIRDVWGFNSEVQWLANRGYAVLQINYRGSKGFGKKFLNAGKKQWGRAMQDDLTDGVDWAVKQEIADPKSVAIYGASYGGYAALIGATTTPDLYRCAVDIVGPTNLNTMLKSFPPYWSAVMKIYYDRVGDPDTEQEFLSSISPLFHVDAIKIPILIAQGANDPQVKQAESEQIVQAMKKKGIEYEYLSFPDEGHGFVKPQNRLIFYKAAEKFLSRYLGGRYES